ncbi:hypothetical protein GGI06_000701 [Coemansia sp. S85]|nr:hypothetical protein GGI06_000701 [Coemansia sp. S85]
MSTFSPLQRLPLHVIELTVKHVTGSSRLVYDGVLPNSHEYRVLLKPLLWVCHNLRAVAYPLFCHDYELNLSSLLFDDLDEYYLRAPATHADYRHCNHLGYSTHHVAKDVTIFLDELAVFNGKALDTLSSVPYDGCTFPLARKLTLVLVNGTEGEADDDYGTEDAGADEAFGIDPQRVEDNIGSLVERIKQIAPVASEYSVRPVLRRDPSVLDQYCSDLVSRLYQLASRIDHGRTFDFVDHVELQVELIRNLTRVSYVSGSSMSNSYRYIQLARNSAPTLQSLVLGSEPDIYIQGIVMDADGNHVSYPCLHTLAIWEMGDSLGSERPVFKGAAPFPILRRLRISMDVPFGDDTFFRGNAATLEAIDMQLDIESISMFRKYKVFVPGSHPRLQVVKFWHKNNSGSELLSEVSSIMNDIGPKATVCQYSQWGFVKDPESTLSFFGSRANIQVLTLSSLAPTLWQVITLIQSLPLLSDLRTSEPSLKPLPDGVDLDLLSEHVRSKYAPMGRRFRCWHITKRDGGNMEEIASCVLLLALACPNFGYAALPGRWRRQFMDAMCKKIGEPQFRQDAPRLNRLLFDGWESRKPLDI